MDGNINFNELWANQKTGVPDAADLLLKANKLRKSNLRRLVITNILLITTSFFIVFIWAYYQPKMMTTKAGIILILFAMIIFVLVFNKSYSLFKNPSDTLSNSDYLKDLLAIKAKQEFMQTTMLKVYFILLSAGLGLYMYEYAQMMGAFWAVFAYGITAVWILINWFYFRPKQVKKDQAKLNEVIGKFELLISQLDETDKV